MRATADQALDRGGTRHGAGRRHAHAAHQHGCGALRATCATDATVRWPHRPRLLSHPDPPPPPGLSPAAVIAYRPTHCLQDPGRCLLQRAPAPVPAFVVKPARRDGALPHPSGSCLGESQRRPCCLAALGTLYGLTACSVPAPLLWGTGPPALGPIPAHRARMRLIGRGAAVGVQLHLPPTLPARCLPTLRFLYKTRQVGSRHRGRRFLWNLPGHGGGGRAACRWCRL